MKLERIALIVAASAVGLFIGSAAEAQGKSDPRTVLQAYLDAVNSANYEALLDVISDDALPFSFRGCTPDMTYKQCLAFFVNKAMIEGHGSLVSPSAEVRGDTIVAVIEVRNDVTRAAKVPRMLGTDTIQVKNGKIISFHFEPIRDDPYNKKLGRLGMGNSSPPETAR